MAALLYRLGRFSARRRWLVLGTWAVALVALAALSGGLTQHADSEEGFSIPGTDASRGLDLIGEKFSGQQ